MQAGKPDAVQDQKKGDVWLWQLLLCMVVERAPRD